METVNAHWSSLLPPVVAIGMAIATKRIYLSLGMGILIGIVLLGFHDYRVTSQAASKAASSRGEPSSEKLEKNEEEKKGEKKPLPVGKWHSTRRAVIAGAEKHLWAQLSDGDHLRVFVFTLLMGGMVGVLYRSGAMLGLVASLSPLAKSRRGGQIVAWALGLIVFFDDYANSLLLGNSMRPLADRLKISREKLAYIVDSTAAPVSGLALISTWVAGEISYIDGGLKVIAKEAAISGTAFQVFVETIPYRFYVIFALLFVPMVALMRRDVGPMVKAEDEALKATSATMDDEQTETNGRWYDAIIPIVVVVLATLWLIFETGKASLIAEDKATDSLRDIFGAGNSYVALVYGSLAGLIVAMLIARLRGMKGEDIRSAAATGFAQVIPALAILWLSWVLSGLTKELETGKYLWVVVQQMNLPLWALPTVVFLLASAVAFSTGTSWGTMSILVPLVVQVCYSMVQSVSASDPFDATHHLMLASVGSVLAGAIFGDHCSPISDTTILSSQASGCDHIQHVRTQMPYALLVGSVSIICGTIPVGLGMPPWISLPLGFGSLIFLLRVLGKPTK